MAHVIGDVPADKLLGMQIDFITKLRSGAITITQLDKFLKGQNPFGSCARNFPMFKIIELGTRSESDDLLHDVWRHGCNVNEEAQAVVADESFTMATGITKVEVVKISGADLGFDSSVSREEVCVRATSPEYGLTLCPAEVGPQLRRQYMDQPDWDRLLIAMQPVVLSDAVQYIFAVEQQGPKAMLKAYRDGSNCLWPAETQWVFVSRTE